MSSSGPLLLTGATGFVGGELMVRYLERTERPVWALVRARDDDGAEARLRTTLSTLLGTPDAYAGRVRAIRGDITQPDLGRSPVEIAQLAGDVTEIVHAAASVSFGLELGESRRINVDGTREVLQLARAAHAAGGLSAFSYVSTAYVAGNHRGTFGEHQLAVGQRFRNPYEQSKHEAESLVKSHAADLPVRVHRPSIVVGESTTGWTQAFNVLYWPLRAFVLGAYSHIPGSRRGIVDVVPVDFVADAIFALNEHTTAEGQTYHLVAGAEATTVGELMELASGRLGRRPPRLVPPPLHRKVVHPLLMRRAPAGRRAVLEQSTALYPYFAVRTRFDDSVAAGRLESLGVSCPPLHSYFDRLVDYAERARWGRRRSPRPLPAAAA